MNYDLGMRQHAQIFLVINLKHTEILTTHKFSTEKI
jgi:hypothetical protein